MLIALITALFLASAAPHNADYAGRNLDFSVEGGVFFPVGTVKIDGETYDTNPEEHIGLQGKYFMSDYFGIGINADYMTCPFNGIVFWPFYIPDGSGCGMSTFYVGPSVTLRYPRPKYDIYGSFGAGYASNKISGAGTEGSLGITAEAAFKYYPAPGVNIGVRVRYLDNRPDYGGDTVNLSGVSALLSLGYSF